MTRSRATIGATIHRDVPMSRSTARLASLPATVRRNRSVDATIAVRPGAAAETISSADPRKSGGVSSRRRASRASSAWAAAMRSSRTPSAGSQTRQRLSNDAAVNRATVVRALS
jgi:hypothetical protein